MYASVVQEIRVINVTICSIYADADFTQTVQRVSEQAQVLSQQSNEEELSAQYSELHTLIQKLLWWI